MFGGPVGRVNQLRSRSYFRTRNFGSCTTIDVNMSSIEKIEFSSFISSIIMLGF